MADLVQRIGDALGKNRRDAIALVQSVGLARTRKLLEQASADLTKRIDQKVKANTGESFTLTQLRASLAQITIVTRDVTLGLRGVIVDAGQDAADHAADHAVSYLASAEKAFRGVGAAPLPLREVAILEHARSGVNASILRRLASSGEPIEDADEEPHPAKMGILQRYGVETLGHFERTLQRGLLAKKSWREMRDDITEQSPFLKQAPAHWAARIVRTESMAAYNRAGWEATREADEQLGDMTKILSAAFDERTAADSYATHGQIRRPEEPFETWYGPMQHPPDRPNDRGIVVPHRISWPIPPYLQWKEPAQIAMRWRAEGRKGPPPERPLMTTVDLQLFGKQEPPKLAKGSESSESEE